MGTKNLRNIDGLPIYQESIQFISQGNSDFEEFSNRASQIPKSAISQQHIAVSRMKSTGAVVATKTSSDYTKERLQSDT